MCNGLRGRSCRINQAAVAVAAAAAAALAIAAASHRRGRKTKALLKYIYVYMYMQSCGIGIAGVGRFPACHNGFSAQATLENMQLQRRQQFIAQPSMEVNELPLPQETPLRLIQRSHVGVPSKIRRGNSKTPQHLLLLLPQLQLQHATCKFVIKVSRQHQQSLNAASLGLSLANFNAPPIVGVSLEDELAGGQKGSGGARGQSFVSQN